LAELLKGAPIAKEQYAEFKKRSEELISRGIVPQIKIIIATDDPAVETYTSMIIKNCGRAGIKADTERFPESADTACIINAVKSNNDDSKIHGQIVMLPMWKQIDEKKVLSSVSTLKDIDGVNPLNAGKTVLGEDSFTPNTAQACKDILEKSGIQISGKHVVIIGRSNIVGKPLANMLIQKGVDATVTLCHSRTLKLKEICRSADILIAAIGSPHFITAEYVNSNQVIVDVGMNEIKDQSGSPVLVGDVDFENVKDIVKAITPVPGGVSPLTHTALIKNIFRAVDYTLNEQRDIN